jgi:hypothetical protein
LDHDLAPPKLAPGVSREAEEAAPEDSAPPAGKEADDGAAVGAVRGEAALKEEAAGTEARAVALPAAAAVAVWPAAGAPATAPTVGEPLGPPNPADGLTEAVKPAAALAPGPLALAAAAAAGAGWAALADEAIEVEAEWLNEPAGGGEPAAVRRLSRLARLAAMDWATLGRPADSAAAGGGAEV